MSIIEKLEEADSSIKIFSVILAVILIYLAVIQTFNPVLWIYGDHISADVHSADFPEEEFESLEQNLDNFSLQEFKERKNGAEGLRKRIIVAKLGYLDVAVTAGSVYDGMQAEYSNDSSPSILGMASSYCMHNKAIYNECEDNQFNKSLSAPVVGWLQLSTYPGTLGDIYKKDTIKERILDYKERAEYYERVLIPGYDQRKLATAIYSSKSGLHVIGNNISEVRIDNNTYSIQESDWAVIKTNLEPGFHRIKSGNQSLNIPIHTKVPQHSFVNKKISIREKPPESEFENVTIYRKGWSKTISIESETNVTVPKRYIYEDGEDYSRYFSIKPTKMNWSSPYITVQTQIGEKQNNTENNLALGMTEKERKNFLWLAEISRKIKPDFLKNSEKDSSYLNPDFIQ